MSYEQTQSGGAARIISSGVLVVVGIMIVVWQGVSGVFLMLVPAVVAAAVFAIFGRLTVSVGDGRIRAAFGVGWPSRTIPVDQITLVEAVRNRWYHGWGIRRIGHGWMFNVAGYDAVELHLSSGKRFRIGTAEPQDLLAAIERERR